MPSLYDQFQTSEDLEVSGVILEYVDSGVEIRVARAGGANKKYLKALERVTKRFRVQIRTDNFGLEHQKLVMQEVYAETVVLGWKGVKDRDDKDMPFSKENCLKLFRDLPALWEDVSEQATSLALFKESINEAQAKN